MDLFIHYEAIIESAIAAVVGGLILAAIRFLIKTAKEKFLNKPLPKSEKKAVYLSTPKDVLKDNCIGRDKVLEDVFNKIRKDRNSFSIKNNILITGEEGIGKTLLCQTLFRYNFQYLEIYLGWIECNGEESIFDIIGKSFKDSRFRRKSAKKLLEEFEKLDRPCVLFVDQVDQNTPMGELEELAACANVTLVLSGLLRKAKFCNYTIQLGPLSQYYINKIFEYVYGEDVKLMKSKDRKPVECLLGAYTKGNPYLAVAIAKAKPFYKGGWEAVLENIRRCEYDDENYFNSFLKQLYKINLLNPFEKKLLSKLSIISFSSFEEVVFEWLMIPKDYVERLCNTYWMIHTESLMYSMDKSHQNVIARLLPIKANLQEAILSMLDFFIESKPNSDSGFRWIVPYIENIRREVIGHAPQLVEEEWFARFALEIIRRYYGRNEEEKIIEWLELCKPIDSESLFIKSFVELHAKGSFLNVLFSLSEIEQIYHATLKKAKEFLDYEEKIKIVKRVYCFILGANGLFAQVMSFCNEYFESYNMNFSDSSDCTVFYEYLKAACFMKDEKKLEMLTSDTIIELLYENERNAPVVAWCFGLMGGIFLHWGNEERAEKYIRHMVVLINEQRGFFHKDIQIYLNISEEEFAEYIHSCDELIESLNSALDRKDPEALYIEGYYCEKHGNIERAFEMYEEAAAKGNLQGMCSLARLYYYKGQEDSRNYNKARKYWEHCCERGYPDSHYWLGELYLNEKYEENNFRTAMNWLIMAASLGSEAAEEKLSEIKKQYNESNFAHGF